MSTSKNLVAAQIGCGAFAVDQHGPNLVRNPHIARVKWACDTSGDRAETFARQFATEKTTASFEDATTDPEVDLIMIATSHEVHVPIIESAAAQTKHIYCEKPMAMDDSQCYKIIRAVRKSPARFCVGYMRRSAPAMIALKREWLAHRNSPKRQPWRYVETVRQKLPEETCTDFFIRVQDESSSYRMVHLDPVRGGGLIIGEAAHWLDLACWLFDGDRPVEIQAWGSNRMRYGICLTFQSGNAMTLTETPNGTFDYPKEMYEIACDGALFRMEHWVENQYYGRPGIGREVFPLHRDPLPDVGTQGGLAGYLEKHRARVADMANAKAIQGTMWTNHGYEEHFDAFVDAIINDAPTPCDELAGYRATMLSQLAMKSVDLRTPLPVPVDKWDCHLEP